ncbi:MAG: response regulator [Desulfuromonadales bacterium]|jgi:CheY-like chemotaxis protein
MSKTLLLADDSITIQKVIQITFAHEDYALTITDNGDDALTKARQIRPDLVIADVYMPGKNGYELTTAIKQDPDLGQTPVLLLTGSFEPFDEDKARLCQADAWIEKPFESQSLIDKVAELLEAVSPQTEEPPAEDVSTDAGPPVAEEATADVAAMAEFAEPDQTETEFAAPSDDAADQEPSPEEAAEAESEALPADQDWSDVAAETHLDESAATVSPPFDTSEAELSMDDAGLAEAPTVEVEEPGPADQDAAIEPVAESLDTEDDQVMPLAEEDILEEEELEPLPQDQTLATWSRDESTADEIFVEPLQEVSVAGEDTFAADTEEFLEEQPVTEPQAEGLEAPAVEEPPAEEPLDFTDEGLPGEEQDVAETQAEGFEAPAVEEPAAEEPLDFPAEGLPGEELDVAELQAEDLEAPAVEEPAAEEPLDVSETEEATSLADFDASPVEETTATVSEFSAAESETKVASLDEAEIERIVEKVVARMVDNLAESILERIAWEVVPDLAESMIREEIRKIKETAA